MYLQKVMSFLIPIPLAMGSGGAISASVKGTLVGR